MHHTASLTLLPPVNLVNTVQTIGSLLLYLLVNIEKVKGGRDLLRILQFSLDVANLDVIIYST